MFFNSNPCLKTGARFCHPCKIVPQIWDTFLPPLQSLPPILGHVSATPAKCSPNSGAGFCNPCKVFPQFWGTFLPPLQNLPSVLGHVYATPAKLSLNSGARFCHPCKIFPQFRGMFLPPLQKCAPDFGQCFQSHTHLFLFLRRAGLDGDCSHDGGNDGCDNLEDLPHC